jgi:threonine/homoserine/homoserine lactone efflux protein
VASVRAEKVAFWTVLGTTLAAGAIQLPLLALGIASVMRSSPWAFELLRWTGAAYLSWFGIRLLLSRGWPPEHIKARRQMQRFKSPRQAQDFLSAHAFIHGHFYPRRHLLTARSYRTARAEAFNIWRQETLAHKVA